MAFVSVTHLKSDAKIKQFISDMVWQMNRRGDQLIYFFLFLVPFLNERNSSNIEF